MVRLFYCSQKLGVVPEFGPSTAGAMWREDLMDHDGEYTMAGPTHLDIDPLSRSPVTRRSFIWSYGGRSLRRCWGILCACTGGNDEGHGQHFGRNRPQQQQSLPSISENSGKYQCPL